MTTELDIANRALGLIRARTVLTSLSGLDPEIVAINAHLGPVRDTILRSFDWNFARDFAALALSKSASGVVPWTTDQPRPPWLYQYSLPDNCVTVRYILGQPAMDPGFNADFNQDFFMATPLFPVGLSLDTSYNAMEAAYYKWELVGEAGVKKIVTDAPNALCCFSRQVTDPSLWDMDFTEAVVTLLAARIVIPISGDVKLSTALHNAAMLLLQEAKTNSANEGVDIVKNISDVLVARRSQ